MKASRRFPRLPIIVAFGICMAGIGLCAEDRHAGLEDRPVELRDIPPLKCNATKVPGEYHTQESGYTAFSVGTDGKVYLGTARYDDYGYWISFDPKKRTFDIAVNIRELVNEHLFDINTQGKTHSKLIVASDGTIYGGTKQGHELFRTRPEIGEDPSGYPGGHLISFNPETGIRKDYGILRKQDGLMNGVLDEKRRRIYFKTEPRMHFVVYDLDTDQVLDKGRVGTWGRYIDMDAEGNVWIPNHGTITKYDVERDELIDLEVRVPQGDPPYYKPYACIAGKDGTKLYGGDLTAIQEFDLAAASDSVLPMRYVCPAVPEPFKSSKDVHTMICDKKGRIYWSARVALENAPDETLIMRYDPKSEECECLGYMVDPDTPRMQTHTSIQGSAIGPDGSFYLMCTYPYYVAHFPKLTRQ